MFTRKFVDYTTLPIDKVTKRGVIKACERCGKPGAYVTITLPQGKIEKWVHAEHFQLFIHNKPMINCVRTVRDIDGKDSWGWFD